MKRFYLNDIGIMDIADYKPEFEGKIFCADPNCRKPVRYIPRTAKLCEHLKVIYPPNHHTLDCNEGTRFNNINKLNAINNINNKKIPILYLNPIETVYKTVKQNEVQKTTNNNPHLTKASTREQDKRKYLKTVKDFARYVSKNYAKLDHLHIQVGEDIKEIRSVLFDPQYVSDNFESLEGKYIYCLGKIEHFRKHWNNPGVTLDFNESDQIVVFVENALRHYIYFTEIHHNNVIVYGLVHKYRFQKQINVNFIEHIQKLNIRSIKQKKF